jgi:hypothetical protein
MLRVFLQALLGLIRHDLFLFRHEFAALHSKLRLLQVASRRPATEDTEGICKAVEYACVWYPRTVHCLQRSVVTVSLLRSYGINAEMVIGALCLPFKAHAWVEIDGRVVNDKPEVQADYLVMERY